jgi:glycoprotein-N-acetylgalactosamine 3-beta-galactosyltransferase
MVKRGFHSGGASYVLSKEALRRFYEAHQAPNTSCSKDGGGEDVEIAKCLRTKHVYPGISLDKYNRERFHPLTFIEHFKTKPYWLQEYAENTPETVSLLKEIFFC